MNVEPEVVECVGTIIERDGNYVLQCLQLPADRYWAPEDAPSWMKPGVGVRMTVTMRVVKDDPTIPCNRFIEEAIRRVRDE